MNEMNDKRMKAARDTARRVPEELDEGRQVALQSKRMLV